MVPNELLTKSFSMFVFVICLLFLFVYTFRSSSLCIGYFYFWYWFWFYLVTCLPFFVHISWYFSLLTFHCFLPANLIGDRILLILIRRFISCVHSIQRPRLFQVFVFEFVRGIHCSPYVFLSKAVLYHFWYRAVFYFLYYLGERNTRKRRYISALNPFQQGTS